MKGGTGVGAMLLIGGVLWLYFDPDSLAVFLSTLLENGRALISTLSSSVQRLIETLSDIMGLSSGAETGGAGVTGGAGAAALGLTVVGRTRPAPAVRSLLPSKLPGIRRRSNP